MINIIIPVFNEEKVIRLFYLELCRFIKRDYSYTITFVDDGSSDKSWMIIKSLSCHDNRVRYIKLDKNYGQQAAIYTGLRSARGDAAIVMDCDLQDPPNLIPAMIKAWRGGAKIVIPQRQSRKDTSFKKLSASLFYFTLNLFSKHKLNPNSGEFWLLDKSALKKLLSSAASPLFLRGSVQRLGLRTVYINYHRQQRLAGKSNFSLLKMVRLARDAYVAAGKKKSQIANYEIRESNILEGKKTAIVGAGISGLTSALYLARLGAKVHIYEKDNEIGGLAASEMIKGLKVDRHYHHIFKNDREIRELISSLGLEQKIDWRQSHVGALLDNRIYAMQSVLDLIRLPNMSLWQKFKLLYGTWRLANYNKIIEGKTSEQLIIKRLGKQAWDNFWKPLFESKFGRFSATISAAWFQGRIRARASSRHGGKEILGYPDGGFDTVIQALKKEILSRGGEVFTETEIDSVTNHNSKFYLSFREILSMVNGVDLPAGRQGNPFNNNRSLMRCTQRPASGDLGEVGCSSADSDQTLCESSSAHSHNVCGSLMRCIQPCPSVDLRPISFDICVSTLAPDLTSKIFPAYKSPAIEYIGFVGVIVLLKKQFSPHYWINVLDKDSPFGVIVEQNNLVSPSTQYHGLSSEQSSSLSRSSLSSRLEAARFAGEMEGSLYNYGSGQTSFSVIASHSPQRRRSNLVQKNQPNGHAKIALSPTVWMAPRNDKGDIPHILYLGKYCENTSEFYGLPDKKISKIASDWLEKIKPGVSEDIIEIQIVRDSHAQPIITTQYHKPPCVCSVDGFYTTSMAHIFPSDRGLNEAVKEAKSIRDLVMMIESND